MEITSTKLNMIKDKNLNIEEKAINDLIYKNKKNTPNTNINKKNNIYDYFLIIAASNKSLNTINEEELLLTPKFIFSYPKNPDIFKELEFYRLCCYKNGIKVKRIEISNEADYSAYLLESNLYSSPIETFSFIKSYDNKITNQYIYGMKFNDIYIFNPKLNNKDKNNSSNNNDVNNNKIYIYIYEKTFLFASSNSCLQLFENACLKILYEKKLNYLNKLSVYKNLFDKNKFNSYLYFNEEKYNKDITIFLQQMYLSNNTKLIIDLIKNSTNQFLDMDESFLLWLLRKIIFYYDYDSFYNIIIMILQEQQILFYGNDLELITFSCFLFTKIISPFEWTFPLIPTLPLDNEQFLSSPVPFIAGMISDKEEINYSLIDKKVCNIIHLVRNKIKIYHNVNKNCKYKGVLKMFRKDIKDLFKKEINSVNINEISNEEIKEKCNYFLNKFKETFKKNIEEKFYELISGVNKNKYKQNEFIDNIGKLNMDNNEEKFFIHFSESQIFISKFLSI